MRKPVFSLSFVIFVTTLSAQGGSARFENTLFIGDSHSYGAFGKSVDAYLRSISTNVTSIASCGSSPSNWMRTQAAYQKTVCGYWRKDSANKEIRVKDHNISPFPEELKNIKPDLTVIALGTNILASPANIQREKAAAEKMLSQVAQSGSQCVWVGPPDAEKQPFKKNLSAGVSELRTLAEKYNCLFVDSSQMTKYKEGTSDGIHYGNSEAKAWGERVTAELKLKLQSVKDKKSAAVQTVKSTSGAGTH